MYKELMKKLRECPDNTLMTEAANAIEELSQLVTFYESATDGYWNDLQRIRGEI